MVTFQVTASEGLIQIGQLPASNTRDKVKIFRILRSSAIATENVPPDHSLRMVY